jgi:hypothetical protein
MLKKYAIGLISVLILIIIISGCSPVNENTSPGNFKGFLPDGYLDISTNVIVDGIYNNYILPGTVMLEKQLSKGQNNVTIVVIKFNDLTEANSFWYSIMDDYFSTIRVFFSTIPFLYGSINEEIGGSYLSAQLMQKWFFLFTGPEENVKEIKDAFYEYMETETKKINEEALQ